MGILERSSTRKEEQEEWTCLSSLSSQVPPLLVSPHPTPKGKQKLGLGWEVKPKVPHGGHPIKALKIDYLYSILPTSHDRWF